MADALSLRDTGIKLLSVLYESNRSKEEDVGILDTILGRREPVIEYRTIDGGHPAPYPDMTDEQLYNYEIAFNVPNRTFDKPPRAAMKNEPRRKDKAKLKEAAPAASPTIHTLQPEPTLQSDNETFGESPETKTAFSEEPELQIHEAPETPSTFAHVVEPAPQAERPVTKPGDMPPLDLARPVRTITTKQPVEIITTRARHPVYKVHGYIDNDDVVTVFTLDGRLSENGPVFLENVPQKQQLHLNVYPNRETGAKEKYRLTQHDSREDADSAATGGRIACITVEFDR